MPAMARRWFVVIVALILVPTGVSFIYSACALPPIAPHRGDGVFADISRRAGPFPLRGYTVTMPEFDLGQPFQAEYHLAGLTDIGQTCGVHLAFLDPRWSIDDQAIKQMAGELRIEVSDSQGRSVLEVTGRLSDYIWAGVGDLRYLYQMNKSFFRPERREEYRLEFSYTPGARLEGRKGFVHLRCGGHM
jgi:hypothetical protein